MTWNRQKFAGLYWKDKHFWRQGRVYYALCYSILSLKGIYLQITFELTPSRPNGWINEKFLRSSLLQTLTLAKKMRLTFKMTSCTFAFLQILLAGRLRPGLHETRSELRLVWNLKLLWKIVSFTWRFHCSNVQMIAFN